MASILATVFMSSNSAYSRQTYTIQTIQVSLVRSYIPNQIIPCRCHAPPTSAVKHFLHTTSWVSIIGYEPNAQVAKKNQNQLLIYISLFP